MGHIDRDEVLSAYAHATEEFANVEVRVDEEFDDDDRTPGYDVSTWMDGWTSSLSTRRFRINHSRSATLSHDILAERLRVWAGRIARVQDARAEHAARLGIGPLGEDDLRWHALLVDGGALRIARDHGLDHALLADLLEWHRLEDSRPDAWCSSIRRTLPGGLHLDFQIATPMDPGGHGNPAPRLSLGMSLGPGVQIMGRDVSIERTLPAAVVAACVGRRLGDVVATGTALDRRTVVETPEADVPEVVILRLSEDSTPLGRGFHA